MITGECRENIKIMKTINKISKRVENTLSMLKVVLSLCTKNVALLMLFTGVFDAYQLFKTKVGELESLVKQKILIITGLSTDKKNTKILLAELAYEIASAIHAFAFKNNDYALMEKVNFTDKKIAYMRDNICIQMCNTIYDLGMANLPDLAPWGIDANTMLTLQTAISLYNDKSTMPTDAIQHRATLTIAIAEKIREITDFKKHQLDVSINRLKSQNKVFVSDYYNEGKVIDSGMRYRKDLPPVLTPDEVGYIAVNVTDKDGNPVEGVTVTLTSGDKVMVDETDEDGEGYHEKVTVGKWTLTIEMYGFQKITVEDLEFVGNDEMEMDFTLEEDEEEAPPVVS